MTGEKRTRDEEAPPGRELDGSGTPDDRLVSDARSSRPPDPTAHTSGRGDRELPPVVLRPLRPSDHALVRSSLLREMRDADLCRSMSDAAFHALASPMLSALVLDNAAAELLVAHSEDDDDQIVGWIAWEPSYGRLLYAYVKSPFRGFGVFGLMFEATGLPEDCLFALCTRDGWSLQSRFPGARYEPRVVRRVSVSY